MTRFLALASAAIACIALMSPITPAGLNANEPPVVVLSRAPLYDATTDAGDAEQLVDGATVSGTMWLSRQAVGWLADGRPLTIELQLGRIKRQTAICLHVPQKPTADVYFPMSIDVVGKQESNEWRWLGAVTPSQTADTASSSYIVRRFCVPVPAVAVDRLQIIVRPRGPYFFVDEIWLEPHAPKIAPTVVSSDERGSVADPQEFALRRNAVLDFMRAYNCPPGPCQPADLRKMILAVERAQVARDDAELLKLTREVALRRVREEGTAGTFTLSVVDPFSDAGPLDRPIPASFRHLHLIGGQWAIGAVSLVQGQSDARSYTTSVTIGGAFANALTVEKFATTSVLAASGRTVADPLVPIRGSISVDPGMQQLVWIAIRANKLAETGTVPVELAVRDVQSGVTRTVSWTVHTATYPAPLKKFYSTVWGYLDRPPYLAFKQRAVADAKDHGVNTTVLPASLVPWPSGAGNKLSAPDYRAFDEAMRHVPRDDQVLVYLGFKGNQLAASQRFGLSSGPFHPAWEARFSAWVRQWVAHVRSSGRDIVFYPVDEPGNLEERRLLVRLASIIRRSSPNIQIYTTLRITEGIDQSFIDSVDIIQLDADLFDQQFARRVLDNRKSVRLYVAETTGKDANPGRVYRAVSWRAFANGFDGAGAWSHSQNGDDGSPWSDLDGTERDRAMVYATDNGWFTSRRWEALRLGNQDAALLSAAYERASTPSARARIRTLAASGVRAIERLDSSSLFAIQGELLGYANATSR